MMNELEILNKLVELEKDLLSKGSPQGFASKRAYIQMIGELDAKGFKRFESVYMIYKAKQNKVSLTSTK